MQHIETVTVGVTPVTSVTFTSIPDTFTDLLVLASVRSNNTTVTDNGGYDPFLYRINALDSGYSGRQLFGTGSAASSASEATRAASAGGTWGRLTANGINNANTTSSVFSNVSVYFPNYRSGAAKSVSCDLVTENNATGAIQEIIAHLNTTTSAITTISFALGISSFVQYSSFSLYGILAGSDGIVSVS